MVSVDPSSGSRQRRDIVSTCQLVFLARQFALMCLACDSGSSIDPIVLHLPIHVEPDTRPMRCQGQSCVLCLIFAARRKKGGRRGEDGKKTKNVKFANERKKKLSKNNVPLVEEARRCDGRGVHIFLSIAVKRLGRPSVCVAVQRRGPAHVQLLVVRAPSRSFRHV